MSNEMSNEMPARVYAAGGRLEIVLPCGTSLSATAPSAEAVEEAKKLVYRANVAAARAESPEWKFGPGYGIYRRGEATVRVEQDRDDMGRRLFLGWRAQVRGSTLGYYKLRAEAVEAVERAIEAAAEKAAHD